ncbi:MAG: hypothetical protein L3J21_09790 [Devosiaceae bacterium]|nr:hypothetical protein [Devosiaceae bacterium]
MSRPPRGSSFEMLDFRLPKDWTPASRKFKSKEDIKRRRQIEEINEKRRIKNETLEVWENR